MQREKKTAEGRSEKRENIGRATVGKLEARAREERKVYI